MRRHTCFGLINGVLFAVLSGSTLAQEEKGPETISIDKATLTTVDGIVETLQKTLLEIWGNFIDHTPFLFAGLLVLIFTAVIANLIGRFFKNLAKRASLRLSLQDLVQRLAVITTWLLGLLLTAMLIFPGLTPTRALGGVGVLSVAIGFAFRDMFENFFAGILLLWKFPFENGDFICCQDLEGRVEDISVRMTQIRQVTGELIVVPNSFLFKNPVYVLTNKQVRRMTLTVGIAYDEQVDQAIPVIEKALKDCQSIDKNLPLEVFMAEFGASSVDIEVTWWANSTPLGQRSSRNEVVAAIKRALDEANIEIPYPYRTLVFKDPIKVNTVTNEEK